MTALVIAEHDNNSIKPATLNTVTAAAQCGGDVHVLVAGKGAEAAAKAAAQIAGVAKVIHVDGDHFAHGLAENMAAQVLAIASAYSHILFPATASGKNIAPRVAASLDVGQISDITKVDAADTFERPIYAGNAIAVVQSWMRPRSSPCAPPALMRQQPQAAARRSKHRQAWPTAASPPSWLGNRQERPPGTDCREDHRLRWPCPGLGREVQRRHDAAGRQAGCSTGRITRCR